MLNGNWNERIHQSLSENQTFLGMETLKVRSKQLYNDCNSPPQARKNGNLEENHVFFQEILAHPKPLPRVGGSSQILGMKTCFSRSLGMEICTGFQCKNGNESLGTDFPNVTIVTKQLPKLVFFRLRLRRAESSTNACSSHSVCQCLDPGIVQIRQLIHRWPITQTES